MTKKQINICINIAKFFALIFSLGFGYFYFTNNLKEAIISLLGLLSFSYQILMFKIKFIEATLMEFYKKNKAHNPEEE